ncbi:hypothetical protein AMTRI_Chr12g269950 [Amborella trichopoda]|uniref:Uncharacterized protein n=1 Tax=Amborella trichopoda TaxID=13333 RepID=W1NN21_AMBTC|nr:hypothetical protein AMTR_s00001p00273070 [Amborella trichopoda]
MKTSGVAIFLLALLCLSSVPVSLGGSPFCNAKCGVRCSKAAVMDRCIKYCRLCCEECNCVPSGTYGNKDQCPCYRDKLSKNRNPKCP